MGSPCMQRAAQHCPVFNLLIMFFSYIGTGRRAWRAEDGLIRKPKPKLLYKSQPLSSCFPTYLCQREYILGFFPVVVTDH